MSSIKKKLWEYFLVLLILVGLIVTSWVVLYFLSFERSDFELGVDFNIQQARDLGLPWKEAYLAILDDLKVGKIRLSAPWNQIEDIENKWDFEDLDFLIEEASNRGVEIILAMGRRTPRWPECHDPAWLAIKPQELVVEKQLVMIRQVVEHYKNEPAIKIWQVENEPLLNVFGSCPKSDLPLLRQEISLVRTLDNRPILITDSGELSAWVVSANLGDYFGSTLYRVTFNKFTGYLYYHLPPIFYSFKAWLVGRDFDTAIISELQVEPWTEKGIINTSLELQYKSMNKERLLDHVKYAKKVGFSSAYLWGVEWWYYLKLQKNDPTLWDTAKALFAE